MIRCSKCGSLNRDGSRFCNECGAELQPTSLRCPVCGTENPVGRVFCDECHARLVPAKGMVPPEQEEEADEEGGRGMSGLSLPTRTTSVENGEQPADEEAYPDWLQGLLEEAPLEESTAAEQKQSGFPFEEGDEVAPENLPDWLSTAADQDADEAEAPPATPEEPTESAEETPDWIADLGSDKNGAEHESGVEEIPDWIADLEPDSEVSSAKAPAFSQAEPEEDTSDGEPAPDWLAPSPTEEENIEAKEHPAIEAPDEEESTEEIPAWLADLESDEDDTDVPEDEATFEEPPSWLRDLASDEEEEPLEATTAEEIPNWLASMAAAEDEEQAPHPEEPTASEDGMPESSEEPTLEEAEEMPDWLRDLESDEDSTEQDEAVEESPTWLRDLPSDEHEQRIEAAEPEEIPDWLKDVEADEGKKAPTTKETSSAQDQAAALPQESAPEPTVQEPEEGDDEIPDWLVDLEPVEAKEEARISPFETPTSEPESEEPEEQPLEAKPVPPPDEGSASEEAPSEEMEPQADSAVFAAEATDLEQTDIPEWLRDLGPAAVESEEAIEAQIPEGLEQADLPNWLRDLQPPGTGPLTEPQPSEEGISETAQEGLIQAEIPDWVQSLQPTGDQVERARPLSEEAGPAVEPEVEGPLGGMHVTIPSLPLVDMPEDFQLAMGLKPPEHIVEDAHLWQELLERPPAEERVVAQKRKRSPWLESILRIAIFLMLTTGLVIVIWGGVPASLFPAPEQPNVIPLEEAVENLQAGDNVAVALEYGPAEVDEMDLLVDAVFDHLLERDVRVQILSTIPVGEALTQERLDWAESKLFADESRTLENLGYWTGGSSGIASFLTGVAGGEETDLLLVFAARPERLRWWVEQNAALGTAARPLGLGVSASVGPLVKPYLLGEQVEGWLTGVQGAAAYWNARGEPNANVTLRTQALMLMQWLAAGSLVLGLIVSLISGKCGRDA